jgi:hypothetical protein
VTGKEPIEETSRAMPDAQKCGEAEAEVVNLRLQLKESLAREARLVERTVQAEEVVENTLATEHELRLQIGRYADFHRALMRSGPWRLIQILRRLVGREW